MNPLETALSALQAANITAGIVEDHILAKIFAKDTARALKAVQGAGLKVVRSGISTQGYSMWVEA